jgi:hypothetical protein
MGENDKAEATPADIIRARGWWTTAVVLQKRIAGFPGSIDTAEGFPSIAMLGDMLRLDDLLARAVKASSATSMLVLVTFTEGSLGYELSAPMWDVEIDGEGDPVPIAEWFGANREGLDAETLQEVVNLTAGELYQGGGGAEPVWTVRRLP